MNNKKTSQFKKQMIISGILVLAALILLVFKLFDKGGENKLPEKNKIEKNGDNAMVSIDPETQELKFVNEYGDELEMFIVDNESGKNIKQDILDMLDGKIENKWNVRQEDGSILFDKDDVKINYFPFIFPEVTIPEISKITVTNEFGTFSIISEGTTLYIDSAKYNIYNEQLLSQLILQARYMLADGYVENPLELSEYGLGEDEYSAMVEVADKSGNVNRVYVGNALINNGGYYMKHADKDAIYIMDTAASIFFNDVNVYLSPIVIKPISEQECYEFETFAYIKNGEPFFACEIIPEEERTGAYINQLHRMTYPEDNEFVLNIETLYPMFTQIGSLSGSEVVVHNVSASPDVGLIGVFYGLDNPTADIGFKYDGISYRFTVGKTFESETGLYYFVYSSYQDTIVLVPEESLSFLNYEIEDFYEISVFQYNINDVAQVELSYSDTVRTYVLNGLGDELKVYEENLGMSIDTPSFRKLYIELLGINMTTYEQLDDETVQSLEEMLVLTVSLKNGTDLVYKFYPKTSLNCYMAINGKHGFVTDRLRIERIIDYVQILSNGETL